MKIAKISNDGKYQTIKLPEEYKFESREVYIKKYGKVLMVFPKDDPWTPMLDSLDKFTDDFMEDRTQPEHQKRERL
jgi:antitoxin VapB